MSNKQHNSLILDTDAVLRDCNGAVVWIQTKPGVYERRMIKTGIEENDAAEIISGLTTG